VRTVREAPVLVAAGPEASAADQQRLRSAGCEVVVFQQASPVERLEALLAELGRRRMTNVLVEGGSRLLGSLLDSRAIDEVHAFIAPKLVGGADALGPIAGRGIAEMSAALALEQVEIQQLGADVYVRARLGEAARGRPPLEFR
jgi:diaminohydroxyphosphoribosylaminopyrimidine deaminase/5-amino-6-(5-phosphoribosylamino)uracil reductase